MALVVQCPDDLVGPTHPVRVVMAVVEKLDLSRSSEPIQAREGVAGRDATDPQLLVALWLYACIRGIGSARELARRCEDSAAFRWLCGGVGVNHRLLSDFRSDHRDALDQLLTQVIASLVDKEVVRVSRVSQSECGYRVSAGAGSFRREERLQELLEKAKEHVAELRRQVDSPEYMALSARQKAVRQRVAQEGETAGAGDRAVAGVETEAGGGGAAGGPRAAWTADSGAAAAGEPTDAEARVMKMANGGFNPAINLQLATDTQSRAIVGVEVSHEGSDNVGLSGPMRQQGEQRSGQKVEQHLLDGGYLRNQDLEQAHQQGVELLVRLNLRVRRRTGAANWSPSPETAPRCGRGSSAWRAKQGNKSINNGRPPAKPSTPTCEVIAG